MAVSLIASACTDLESATNLNPEGPPMIQQVRFKETAMNATGALVERNIFGFGSHPLAGTTDYPAAGQGQMATASVTGQRFRIIMDELLVGNYLEEIECRGPVDDDAYDQVPLGATPDDIAKCSVAKDVLPASCPASMAHAVCICKIDGGCGDVAKGQPVGVADMNQDGAADDTHFIAGAVGIRCGTFDVPIKVDESYWNPSGDQNKPAMGGFDVLGPAIVLVPDGALPTNLECGLTFSPNVVDKQGNQVCAPVNGDITKDCMPGNVDAFKFTTIPLRMFVQSFADGATGVDRNTPIILGANAPVDAATLTAITVTQGGNPGPAFTMVQMSPTSVRLTFAAPLDAMTTYEVHVSTALTDAYGQPLPQPSTTTFTTGA